MRKHVQELHQQEGRPFQCIVPSCGVKFARRRYLRRHENLSHKEHPLLVERDRQLDQQEQQNKEKVGKQNKEEENRKMGANVLLQMQMQCERQNDDVEGETKKNKKECTGRSEMRMDVSQLVCDDDVVNDDDGVDGSAGTRQAVRE